MKKIKIALIDKNEILRKGLSKLLAENTFFSILGEFKNINESKKILQDRKLDIVILDVKNDIDLSEILSYNSGLKIICLSDNTNIGFIAKLVSKGISSYLFRSTSLEEVIKTIHMIGQGETYFPSEISSLLLQHLSNPIKRRTTSENQVEVPITPREMEILKYITDEFTNKEIAAKLFISRRTVDAHRRNLLSKLEVKNTVGLVKYYIRLYSREKHYTF